MMEAEVPTETNHPYSEMLLPPTELADCIYAGFLRDTTGCRLPPESRFNHFAAAPLCTIAFFFTGESVLVSAGGKTHPDGILVPPASFSGPQQFPSTSWNPGKVSALMVSFFPDAFLEMTGISAADYKNKTVSLEALQNRKLVTLSQRVVACDNAIGGWRLLCEWASQNRSSMARNVSGTHMSFTGWTGGLLKRAAHSGFGRSVRQIERRVKRMTGQTRRELERFATLEQTFFAAIEQNRSGTLSAADVAAQAGFADQSHMGRNVRAQTGHSPIDLMRRLERDEAFWCYRLIAGQSDYSD